LGEDFERKSNDGIPELYHLIRYKVKDMLLFERKLLDLPAIKNDNGAWDSG
jgi:hypothetical protein